MGAPVWPVNGSLLAYVLGARFEESILSTPTTFALETDGTWTMADYDQDGVPDLVFIKTANAATKKTEVHIASGSSTYGTRILDTASVFGEETNGTWMMADQDRDGIPDLVFVQTAGTTSKDVEVLVASGKSQYKTKTLDAVTSFPEESDGTWTMADYDGDGYLDLVFIKTANTTSKNVVVRVFSGAPSSNFKSMILDKVTVFAEETDGTWTMADYDRDGIPDLVFIKTANSGSGDVEVHIASGKSVYQTFILHQASTFAQETDGAFSLVDYDEDKVPDLVFIKTAGTSSKDVEVHVASGN